MFCLRPILAGDITYRVNKMAPQTKPSGRVKAYICERCWPKVEQAAQALNS